MTLSNQLIGTWLLRSRIDRTHDGQRHPEPTLGDDPIALLHYDATGHFAAQFMKRDRTATPLAATHTTTSMTPTPSKNNTQAHGGYDAYFGTYAVDDAQGLVTQTLLGSLAPANVGMVLTRAMRVERDTLTIQLETHAADGTPLTRTLTWERAKHRA